MQRGFTLIEVAVVAGITALLLLGAGLALGAKPLAMRTASLQFRAQLSAARALAAASGNGATIVVQPDGDGFKSIVYAGRPNLPPLTATSVPPVSSQAQIAEANVGAPPFTIFVSSSGSISVLGSYPPRAQFNSVNVPALAAEPPCPGGGRYVLTLASNGASDSVDLPCGGPVSGAPVP